MARFSLGARVGVKRKVRPQSSASIALVGVITVSTAGSASGQNPQLADLTGVASTAAIAELAVESDVSTVLAGRAATAGAGTPTVSGKASVTATGAQIGGSAQPVTVTTGPVVPLTTLLTTAAIGTVTTRAQFKYAVTGASSAAAAGTDISPTANVDPAWDLPEPYPLAAVTEGVGGVRDLSQYVTDTDGPNALVYDKGTVTPVEYASLLTVNASSGLLTVNSQVTVPAQGYIDVVVGADDGYTSTDADWAARSAGSGVIWATRFDTAAEVNNWRYTNEGGGVDIIFHIIPKRAGQILMGFLSTLSGIFLGYFGYASYELIASTKATGQVSISMDWLPMYVVYLSALVGSLLMLLEFFKLGCRFFAGKESLLK